MIRSLEYHAARSGGALVMGTPTRSGPPGIFNLSESDKLMVLQLTAGAVYSFACNVSF